MAVLMCGRFALITPPVRLARYFQATLADGVEPENRPSWNVAPTDQVLGLRERQVAGQDEPTRTLAPYRWGLIPSWAKDASSGSRLFNARGETVTTKPSFRSAFEARRIIIPADGFYEWHKQGSGSKQPHYFTRVDGEPMAFAGLAEWWRDKHAPDDAPGIRSCTIITTSASQDMDGIHDRMPVILSPDTFDVWLNPGNENLGELAALVRAAPAGTVTHRPVSQRVGNVRNNDAELIEPI
ncbi:MAG TPA: SOS response-associated peptidase [Acidimicrobiales bacterium]|jgi:putative SOS response-associated peptidase YedK|nr:SOS response-associated peptidase [Acidimicrobiales bacterium]